MSREEFVLQRTLSEDEFFDRLPGGQGWKGPPGLVVQGQAGGIDSKVLINGCHEVAHFDSSAGHIGAVRVGGTDDLATRQASSAKNERAGSWPVIASWLFDSAGGIVGVRDFRSSSKFTSPDCRLASGRGKSSRNLRPETRRTC